MTIFHRRHRVLALGVLALAGLAGRPLRAQASPAGVRLDTAAVLASARPEIEAANAAWLPGLKRHDAASIASAYADSGLFISADGTVVRGRAAVAAMYAARFQRQRAIRTGAVVQDGLAVVGPALVYEWGHGWVEMEPAAAGGAPVRAGGTYLTVWQRAGDGHWHIVRNLTF
jgi:uncharacterized protein (TIGR02246 family)